MRYFLLFCYFLDSPYLSSYFLSYHSCASDYPSKKL
ncbi:hypothetical protein [Oribacterium sinus]